MTTSKDSETTNDDAAGWTAIDRAFASIYGDQEPYHWGTIVPFIQGGPDPLDGISAYRVSKPQPHWHFVSYGLSELYEKETDNPEVSGFGFEFTFRLENPLNLETPPPWVFNVLQNLARYVFQSGRAFSAGHRMHLNGPIALEEQTSIEAILFAEDQDVPTIETPHGKVQFLQLVGLTNDEYQALLAWHSSKFLQLLRQFQPGFICKLERSSLLEDAGFRTAWEAGRQADGSSTDSIFTNRTPWEASENGPTVRIDTALATRLSLVLPGRLPFGEDLFIVSGEGVVRFEPTERSFVEIEGKNLVIGLSEAQTRQLCSDLRGGVGLYTVAGLPGLEVNIEPTVIRDHENAGPPRPDFATGADKQTLRRKAKAWFDGLLDLLPWK